jgi:hypothetical protein
VLIGDRYLDLAKSRVGRTGNIFAPDKTGSSLLGSALARSHRRPWIGELGFGEPVLRHPQRQRALLQHGCRIARLRD